MKLDRTPQFEEALRLMRGDAPFVFITGRAGTGKSTLLRYFCETMKQAIPVLAPTGVAALNVNGETIHRFFRFPPGITVRDAKRKGASAAKNELYSSIDTILIDEISMVRADLLDCVDAFLRVARGSRLPFGGVRVVAIGDLYQLPPVVTTADREAFFKMYKGPYFFSAQVMEELLADEKVSFVELEKVYRQTEDSFIALLNAVRNRSITEEELVSLNQRVAPRAPAADALVLTPTNDAADAINADCLARIPWKAQMFEGSFTGGFSEREAPTDIELRLKRGARVMCVVNDSGGGFVNGSLGRVTAIRGGEVDVDLDEGPNVTVSPHTWTIYRSVFDRKKNQLSQERLGSFTQIPLRLAWALTIHKSQGKSFDRLVVDMGRGAFAAGQTYVALSRCRSFEGLTLIKPITASHIRLDYSIMKFVTSLQYRLASRSLSLDEKIARLERAAAARTPVEITYLKAKDEKSRRVVVPKSVEDDEYNGHPYLALRAFCQLRKEERTFNVERILELRDV